MAEKRKQWRKNDGKGVKRSNLREIRKVPKEESESEDDFVGGKGDINALQFLNLLTTEENNRLVDETWCINHSRIEVEPETDSDEDPDDPDSEE